MLTAQGYAHPLYAASLSEFGVPQPLPGCGGWLLRRPIASLAAFDAMGCYPLFACGDWRRLEDDLRGQCADLVSVAMVADPFAPVSASELALLFDRVLYFKDHYVVDLAQPLQATVSASHRANVRRALRQVDVRVAERPGDRLGEWLRLFEHLCRRHTIRGIKAFSPRAFEAQLEIPGMVMFEARVADAIVGLDLWFVHGDVAYGHLVAFDEVGYRTRASYATKWAMLEYFSGRVRWVDLGGTAGLSDRTDDGLAAFKAGWATGTRPVYFCGKVLDAARYADLVRATGTAGSGYFPAYRTGEFS